MSAELSKYPVPDVAEQGAFFPSSFSRDQFTSSTSDLSDADYDTPYSGSKRVLVICADERYLPLDNETLFSTGNHPVETLLPMYHLHKAGFECDIATLSGQMVKFEHWAMPEEDVAVMGFYNRYLSKFRSPLKLREVMRTLDAEDRYAAIFIPGGHGALIGLPESEDVAELIKWSLNKDKHLISICHGPAAFMSLADGANPLAGYEICAFPDATDKQTPDMGYMPGHLKWYFGDRLKQLGLKIINDDIKGAVHKDRKVLTGDSPYAANALGKLAAEELLKSNK
ncbi:MULTISPECIES: glyoxalase III HchA [unclassified Pantoea]|uniref:glyoxalase III HchA n=1 Tax=unclassified Pantoea TaxID=2630326 RepID=UPI001CD1B106|nr:MULTISPECIES: glyoxalase III HchA [unclassified Pantoea]MCA1176674.1 protein deglycase HchA [Pantoea sp. alder69]MCA1251587.1 protein deglycase HchA [Pantoea sp. alder70]MCA1264282.1 protein deglycase HchA [Pantoea sp. alder81]